MEWILLSLAILGASLGATGGVVYYYHRFYDSFVQQRLVQEKQLDIYEEIVTLVGRVKATLEYTSGDETLSEWREALREMLREMLGKCYQWSIFLPDSISDLPAKYAGKVAHSLSRLDNLDEIAPDDMDAVAEIFAEIKKLENEAAQELQHGIRRTIGVI